MMSCAPSKQFVDLSSDTYTAENTTIYVIRDSGYGGLSTASIYQNEKLIGKLESKSYITWTTKEDSIDLTSKIGKPTSLKLNLEAGKTYYTRQGFNVFGGIVRAASTLEIISEEEGKSMIEKLKTPVVVKNDSESNS